MPTDPEPAVMMTGPLIERTRPDPMLMIADQLGKGVSVADLKELFELQRRWEEQQAVAAHAEAVTTFQRRCPAITKRRTADVGGKFTYQYASYDDIDFEVRPLLNECGLVVSFTSNLIPAAKCMEITCTVRHGTYATEHKMTVPIPSSAMNDAQAYGSALSYAKRYALTAALNIVVTDADDDATRAKITMVTDEELKVLRALIEEKRVDEERFLKWAAIDRLEDMSRDAFPKAKHTLETYPDPKTDTRPAVKPTPAKKGAAK